MDFDKTNIENLTNDELFKLFKKNGLMCGPINQTTRSVYSKKIKKFINEKNHEKMGLKSKKNYFLNYSDDIFRKTELINQEDQDEDESKDEDEDKDELKYNKV